MVKLTCGRCHKEKPVTLFTVDLAARTGRCAMCSDCLSAVRHGKRRAKALAHPPAATRGVIWAPFKTEIDRALRRLR